MVKDKKRMKVTYKHPNPLFEKWLEEWRDEAALKNQDIQHAYNKALRSLKKYPVPLKSGKECLILENFGHRICSKLDEKLKEYQKTHPFSDLDKDPHVLTSNSAFVNSNHQKANKPAKKRRLSEDKTAVSSSPAQKKQKPYVPAFRSGAYALLVTLYRNQSKASYPGFMTKADLQKSAQALCDASFYKPDPGSYYTAWSSMSTLIKKALVSKTGQLARFSLTDEGSELADKLEKADTYTSGTSASGNMQDQSLSSQHSYRATPRKKTSVPKKNLPKKYSAFANAYLSDEDIYDPDNPDIVDPPDIPPRKSPECKPTSSYGTGETEKSNFLKKSCRTDFSSMTKTDRLIDNTHGDFIFSESSFRKPAKNTSPIPNSYSFSDSDDELRGNYSLKTFSAKTGKENESGRVKNLLSSKTALSDADEPIVIEDSPQKSEKISDKRHLSRKVSSLALSDSDEDGKRSEPSPQKQRSFKDNFSSNKSKPYYRKSHDLSDIEDDLSLTLPSKPSKKLNCTKDDSTLSYSLSEDESDPEITCILPSVRWSQSKKDNSSTSIGSVKSKNNSPANKNSVPSYSFKSLERQVDSMPESPEEAQKVGAFRSSTNNSKAKSNYQSSSNEGFSSYLPADNAETISDPYFGYEEDDELLSQMSFLSSEPVKPKDIAVNCQEISSNLFSQTSSTSSIKSSVPKGSPKKCSDSSQSSSQSGDSYILMPNTFDIILIVDNQESSNRSKPFLLELDNNSVNYEVRHLKVGDYIWIARCKTTNNELVLPYIIERKRMDDLGKSIKDGRFHEQKVRLKQSGMERLIYLVETYGGSYGLPETTIHQAAINTYIVDNFQLKYTSNYKHSASYLATLTRFISKQFKDKILASCDKNSLPSFKIHEDFASLMTFKDFSKGMSKVRNYTIKEMFIKHLLQLYGMSVEKAIAITDKYPTPKSLLSAYKNGGGENMLSSLTFGPTKRSIGPVLSKNVYQLYTLKKFL